MRSRQVAFVYGTRPQVIKASRLLPALRTVAPVTTIDSGQHYDYQLNQLLYRQLDVPPADHYLEVGSGPLVDQTAAIMTRAAAVFQAIEPALVVVIGDTVTTLGAGLAAAQSRLPLVHVEAGLRAHDPQMAEEISRRTVDHLAQLLCAPSEAAAERLRAERVPGIVTMTGDVARDVLEGALPSARAAVARSAWPVDLGRPFVLATLHRAELVDHADRLAAALGGLAALPVPVIWALHPRTRASLSRFGLLERTAPHLHLVEPIGYLEAIGLVEAATAVVTDSGGIQREAYWIGTPCLTVRPETEWVETVTLGANRLFPLDDLGRRLATALDRWARDAPRPAWSRDAYGTGDAAQRIAEAVRGLADSCSAKGHDPTL